MEQEFTCVELSDEQLELVVGGCHHHRRHWHKAIAANFALGSFAANFANGSFFNQQNVNATNQVGFININITVQNNILIII